ncbi:MAG: NifB/NifX family molybdenum-iron cluster-binding protein [Candidatus Nealsonbacteria bacterium]|nr:NifB/NifX family molybdenum-iron cluster-binding protein [Candidatus Nealsonbacteria bacterium]
MATVKKIAIPAFDTRVSPRFDCAKVIVVLTVDGEGEASDRDCLRVADWAPHERVNRLLELGIDTVICGGIDRWSAASLQAGGVTVYGWVTGEVDNALAALLQGELDRDAATEGHGRCVCRRFPADDRAGAGPLTAAQGMKGRRGRQRRQGGNR